MKGQLSEDICLHCFYFLYSFFFSPVWLTCLFMGFNHLTLRFLDFNILTIAQKIITNKKNMEVYAKQACEQKKRRTNRYENIPSWSINESFLFSSWGSFALASFMLL